MPFIFMCFQMVHKILCTRYSPGVQADCGAVIYCRRRNTDRPHIIQETLQAAPPLRRLGYSGLLGYWRCRNSLCYLQIQMDILFMSEEWCIHNGIEAVFERLYGPQPIHKTPEQTFLFVMIAKTHSGAARMTPDLCGHEQKAQP